MRIKYRLVPKVRHGRQAGAALGAEGTVRCGPWPTGLILAREINNQGRPVSFTCRELQTRSRKRKEVTGNLNMSAFPTQLFHSQLILSLDTHGPVTAGPITPLAVSSPSCSLAAAHCPQSPGGGDLW